MRRSVYDGVGAAAVPADSLLRERGRSILAAESQVRAAVAADAGASAGDEGEVKELSRAVQQRRRSAATRRAMYGAYDEGGRTHEL
eukprot:gene15992-56777_t